MVAVGRDGTFQDRMCVCGGGGSSRLYIWGLRVTEIQETCLHVMSSVYSAAQAGLEPLFWWGGGPLS